MLCALGARSPGCFRSNKNLLLILYVSACSKRIVVLRNPTDHKFDFCVCIRCPKGSQQVLVKSHSKMDAKKARRNAKSSLLNTAL